MRKFLLVFAIGAGVLLESANAHAAANPWGSRPQERQGQLALAAVLKEFPGFPAERAQKWVREHPLKQFGGRYRAEAIKAFKDLARAHATVAPPPPVAAPAPPVPVGAGVPVDGAAAAAAPIPPAVAAMPAVDIPPRPDVATYPPELQWWVGMIYQQMDEIDEARLTNGDTGLWRPFYNFIMGPTRIGAPAGEEVPCFCNWDLYGIDGMTMVDFFKDSIEGSVLDSEQKAYLHAAATQYMKPAEEVVNKGENTYKFYDLNDFSFWENLYELVHLRGMPHTQALTRILREEKPFLVNGVDYTAWLAYEMSQNPSATGYYPMRDASEKKLRAQIIAGAHEKWTKMLTLSSTWALELPEDFMGFVMAQGDAIPLDFALTRLDLAKTQLEGSLVKWLCSRSITEETARTVTTAVFEGNSAATTLEESISELQKDQVLVALRSRGISCDEETARITSRILIQRKIEQRSKPILEESDLKWTTSIVRAHTMANAVKAHGSRLKDLMYELDLAMTGDPRDNDLIPVITCLLDQGHDLSVVDEKTVKAEQMTRWLTPRFKTDPALAAFNAQTENLRALATKMLEKNIDVYGTPTDSYGNWYRRLVLSKVPREVTDYEENQRTILPEQRAKWAERVAQERANLKECVSYTSAMGTTEINDHPMAKRYDTMLEQLIEAEKARKYDGQLIVDWNNIAVDVHRPLENPTPTPNRRDVRERYFKFLTHLDPIMGGDTAKLGLLLERVTSDGTHKDLRTSFYSTLETMIAFSSNPVKHDVVRTAVAISHQLTPGACDNRYMGALEGMSRLLTGNCAHSVESKISHVIHGWLTETINRTTTGESEARGFPGGTRVEQENFMRMTGKNLLGLKTVSTTMEHLACVRVNNPGVYCAVWKKILSHITVDNMVAVVQGIIQPKGARDGTFDITTTRFETFAQKQPMLWEYILDGHSLFEEETGIVKRSVVGSILYGLGYLDLNGAPAAGGVIAGEGMAGGAAAGEPATDLPECWPKRLRTILRAGMEVEVGTE